MKAALLTPLLFVTSVFAADETEPPLGYTLKIDGKEFHMMAGEETPLKGSFTDPKATIVPDATRHFDHGGVRFAYPGPFTFLFQKPDRASLVWTVKGTKTVFMINQYTARMTAESHAQTLLAQYGEKGSSEAVSYTLHGVDFKGVRVKLKLSPVTPEIYQDVLVLPSDSGTRVLMLQDRPEGGKHSQEFTDAVKLLDGTLEY